MPSADPTEGNNGRRVAKEKISASKSDIRDTIKHGAIIETSVEDEMHKVHSFRIDLSIASKEDIDAFFASMPQRTFEKHLVDLQSVLVKTLVDAGWPDPAQAVLHDHGVWRYKPEELQAPDQWKELVKSGEKFSPGWSYVLHYAKVFSEAWFAAKLYRCALDTRILRGDARDMSIFLLGHTYATARSRGLLKDVVRGKTIKRAASKGGIERAKAKKETSDEVIVGMRRLLESGKTVSGASAVLSRKLNSKPETIRSHWYRHKRKTQEFAEE